MKRTTRHTTIAFTTALLAVPLAALHAAETATLSPIGANAGVNVIVEPNAPPVVQHAATDLRTYLRQLYPTAAGKQIRLVTNLSMPESYEIAVTDNEATIAGGGPRGVVYGVYALLDKLGCGFYLSGDVIPAARIAPLSLKEWKLADKPLVPTRLVFDWHNFLSGCSTWNLPEWQSWIRQSQKMGYNAIMVHAYGNNPMAGFTFEGIPKPVGYLSTTVKGRDWSTMHVNDVRRLFGGEVFNSPVFGADAGLVSDEQRVAAAQTLMHDVFVEAAERSMDVYFAVDVDTPSANPPELVGRLPESARFAVCGATSTIAGQSPSRIWLPKPDTPEGYRFYRAQVAELVKNYPHITRLVVWFRRDGTPMMNLKPADFPAAWQQEFAAEVAKTPEVGAHWHAAGLFAVGKVLRTFDRALEECRAERIKLAAGTWGFEFLPAADRFFPAGVPLIGLDYDVLHEKPQLGDAKSREPLRTIGSRRPVIPVVWAHHDDGHYIGRPYTPLPEFAAKLADANAAGFGIIHWTTRPLDLYFTSLARQVWQCTKDESLPVTCNHMAARALGDARLGEYLHRWITEAPRFGRETSDYFIDRPLTNIPGIVAGSRDRLALLGLADDDRVNYYKGLERFITAFHETHDLFQRSQAALKSNHVTLARQLMVQCRPESVIEQFARFSSLGGITRGEQGLVVSMNLRWLTHIVRHRQALGLEPVRIKFGPTQHDKLAQSRGKFTFHFTPEHAAWEVWGEEETGARVFTAPAAPDEIARTGIETAKPLSFTVRPIMSVDSRNKSRPALLLPGDYRLRLLLLDPDSTAVGQRVFAVLLGSTSDIVDIFKETGGANRLLKRVYPVTLRAPGEVAFTLTPIKGKAVISGAVLEPVNP